MRHETRAFVHIHLFSRTDIPLTCLDIYFQRSMESLQVIRIILHTDFEGKFVALVEIVIPM